MEILNQKASKECSLLKNRDLKPQWEEFHFFLPQSDQPGKCLKYVCTFNIKINKSQAMNDLRA